MNVTTEQIALVYAASLRASGNGLMADERACEAVKSFINLTEELSGQRATYGYGLAGTLSHEKRS